MVLHSPLWKSVTNCFWGLYIDIWTDCGPFPEVEDATKRVIKSVAVNATYTIEQEVTYECAEGFEYTVKNNSVCNAELHSNDTGKCVAG